MRFTLTFFFESGCGSSKRTERAKLGLSTEDNFCKNCISSVGMNVAKKNIRLVEVHILSRAKASKKNC